MTDSAWNPEQQLQQKIFQYAKNKAFSFKKDNLLDVLPKQNTIDTSLQTHSPLQNKVHSKSSRRSIVKSALPPQNKSHTIQHSKSVHSQIHKGLFQPTRKIHKNFNEQHEITATIKKDIDKIEYLFKSTNTQELVKVLQDIFCLLFIKDNQKMFIELIFLVAEFCLSCRDYNTGVFIYHQSRQLGEQMKNLSLKCRSLICLADTAKMIKMYQECVQIYKKALEYSWMSKDSEKELEIYEKLSILYFYMRDLKRGVFYHNKFFNHHLEKDDSPLKIISSYLMEKQMSNSTQINHFGPGLYGRLQLPFYIDSEDVFKSQYYQRTNYQLILQNLIDSEEFQFFQISSPRFSQPDPLKNGFQQKQKGAQNPQIKKISRRNSFQNIGRQRVEIFQGINYQEKEQKVLSIDRIVQYAKSRIGSNENPENIVLMSHLRDGNKRKTDFFESFKQIFGIQ